MVKEQRAWKGHWTCVAYASKSGSSQRSCTTVQVHCTTLELELTLKGKLNPTKGGFCHKNHKFCSGDFQTAHKNHYAVKKIQ